MRCIGILYTAVEREILSGSIPSLTTYIRVMSSDKPSYQVLYRRNLNCHPLLVILKLSVPRFKSQVKQMSILLEAPF